MRVFSRLTLFNLMFLFALSGFTQSKVKQPNIIIILADDLGWADLGCYGSRFYETPHLDRMASAGHRYTQAYANSPVCSPSRASLLTGKYPIQVGITDWIPGRHSNSKQKAYEPWQTKPTMQQLPLSEWTLAEQARSVGYKTFFVGKWHLGADSTHGPTQQGFDVNIGGWDKGGPTGKLNDSTGGYFTPYGNPRLVDGPPDEYLTDRLTQACIEQIQSAKQQPFLLFYSMYAVHNPMQAPAKLIRKYKSKQLAGSIREGDRFIKDEAWMEPEAGWKRRLVQDNPIYAAMIENMDSNIGKIFEALERGGLDENTLVIFSSDNGGLSTAEGSVTSNDPLRNGKGWLYEGGIRVPFLLYWKGQFEGGQVIDRPITLADLFPSLSTLMQAPLPKSAQLDGNNLFARTEKKTVEQRALFWYYPHYSNQGGKPAAAIREGRYKLLLDFETGRTELFDLLTDPAEKKDIAQQESALHQALKNKLIHWLKQYPSIERNVPLF